MHTVNLVSRAGLHVLLVGFLIATACLAEPALADPDVTRCAALQARMQELRAEIAKAEAELAEHCPAFAIDGPFGLGPVGSMARLSTMLESALHDTHTMKTELARLQCGSAVSRARPSAY